MKIDLFKLMGLIFGVLILGMLIVGALPFGWKNVKPTEVAVEIDKFAGKVKQEPLGVGYHFYNRWATDLVVYEVNARAFPSQSMATEEKDKDYNMNVKTNDGQNVSVDFTVIYSLDAKFVPMLHQTVGQNYEDQILLPQVRSEARIAIGGYAAEDIYQGKVRDEIQTAIKDKLVKTLAAYPAIHIQDALMRDFKFSGEFEKAIENKKLAAQQVEVNKNRAAAQEQEALRVKAEAEGARFQAVQQATGRAESAKIEADAERYKLEQEAAGQLAKYKATAEGQKQLAEAVGGGGNLVQLRWAESLAPKLQIWGIPTGANSTSIQDLSGVFGGMFKKDK